MSAHRDSASLPPRAEPLAAPSESRRAALSLALLLPAPSIGVAGALILFPGTAPGRALFAICKIWMLVFPVVWHVFVDFQPLGLPPPRRRGLLAGAASGVAVGAVILIAYVAAGRELVDPHALSEMVEQIGLDSKVLFLVGALYWCCVNSLLEEYVWRWFVFRQFDRVAGHRVAILASSLAFTAHHLIALAAFLPPLGAAIASAGIAAGGALWALMYARFRSIWPSYLSHVIADAAVFAIGYAVLYG